MDISVQELAWSEELNTDVASLDLQHKDLAHKVEGLKLYAGMSITPDGAFEMFESIIDDLSNHFDYEEMIMENMGYTDAGQHKRAHRLITRNLDILRNEVIIPRKDEKLLQAIHTLENVIVNHLTGEDTKIRLHLHR